MPEIDVDESICDLLDRLSVSESVHQFEQADHRGIPSFGPTFPTEPSPRSEPRLLSLSREPPASFLMTSRNTPTPQPPSRNATTPSRPSARPSPSEIRGSPQSRSSLASSSVSQPVAVVGQASSSGKKKVYAVYRGREVGIFHDWYDHIHRFCS